MAVDRIWEQLPRELGTTLRPHLSELSGEILDALRDGVPAYARPLEGAFGVGIRTGVERALHRFVDLVEGEPVARERQLYFDLGRGERREGRSLDALLAAYRLGARVAWRRVSAITRDTGFSAETQSVLAEAVFAYIDELSAESAAGYAEEQSRNERALEMRRATLVELLVRCPPVDPPAIEAAAAAAGWKLPRDVAALVWSSRKREIASKLPAGSVWTAGANGIARGFVPDPDAPGRRRALRGAAGRRSVALGTTVPWTDSWRSAKRAFATWELASRGVIPGSGLVVAGEHLGTLLACSDPTLVEEIGELRLRPLEELNRAARERLTKTLRVWLDHQGNVAAVASVLHLHPQSVRYRVGQLRDAFGPDLDDPDVRFELLIALRGRGRETPKR